MKTVFSLFIIFVLLFAPSSMAEQLKKEYFKSTVPGTWAKQEIVYQAGGESGQSFYTYTRYDDIYGQVVFGLDIDFTLGSGSGSVVRQLFVLEPGFDAFKRMLEYPRYIETNISQYNEGAITLSPQSVVEAIRNGSADFSNAFRFIETKNVEGTGCDLYRYSAKTIAPNVTVNEGEVCLSESVPFGVVFQSGKVMDESGKVVSGFDIKLKAMGEGSVAPADFVSMIPVKDEQQAVVPVTTTEIPKPETVTIGDAFKKELVRFKVEVKEGTRGKALLFTINNKSDRKIKLVIPTAKTELEIGLPVNVLSFMSESRKELELDPEESVGPIELVQLGSRMVVEGSFELSVFEGNVLYSGSATMETVY